MGSGDRFSFQRSTDSIALGIQIGKFPHALSIGISFLVWDIYFGFGKGYDE